VTPTQEEQDEEDDHMFDQEAPVSPPWFTAAQKGKGNGKRKVSTSHHPFSYDGDDAGNVSDHSTSE
jgi:hypothetical protein